MGINIWGLCSEWVKPNPAPQQSSALYCDSWFKIAKEIRVETRLLSLLCKLDYKGTHVHWLATEDYLMIVGGEALSPWLRQCPCTY